MPAKYEIPILILTVITTTIMVLIWSKIMKFEDMFKSKVSSVKSLFKNGSTGSSGLPHENFGDETGWENRGEEDVYCPNRSCKYSCK